MGRSLSSAFALAMAAAVVVLPGPGRASDRSLPMRFDIVREGPSETCGAACRVFISATGVITTDTAAAFAAFVQDRDLAGAVVVFDSEGGSVRGAIALGREIRRLSLDTTVGRVVAIETARADDQRGVLSPHADCESMCAFVLLGGVGRSVPREARVMVHQIWLGDRRDDPAAATYSAADLVLVQHDIGELARYTADMGASMDMLDLALRIPPWEPMHTMTRDELARMRVTTDEADPVTTASIGAPPRASGRRSSPEDVPADGVSERRWAMIDKSGAAALARRHPLTREGETIGSFDLMIACGPGGDSYDVRYVERRRAGRAAPLPPALEAVAVEAKDRAASLTVVSSERRSRPDELVTVAAGAVPAALIDGFAAFGSHSLTVATRAARVATAIRLGNTGAQLALPQLKADCAKTPRERAGLAAGTRGAAAGK